MYSLGRVPAGLWPLMRPWPAKPWLQLKWEGFLAGCGRPLVACGRLGCGCASRWLAATAPGGLRPAMMEVMRCVLVICTENGCSHALWTFGRLPHK